MKVKQLIKRLQSCDPDSVVLVTSSNFELNNAGIPVNFVTETKEGSKTKRHFRDAFDGESYTKEVWSSYGGKLKVVHLS